MLSVIQDHARKLGFNDLGITDTRLPGAAERLQAWLAAGHHGDMAYMARYGDDRTDPSKIVPGTTRVIVVRMDYLPANPAFKEVLQTPQLGMISRYAQNRDYHKLMRKRLQKLAKFILSLFSDREQLNPSIASSAAYSRGLSEQSIDLAAPDLKKAPLLRPFVDSGPIMEKPLAVKAGLGWIGKNTMLIQPKAGSFFFLGTLLTNLDLPLTEPFATQHCGRCSACISICPTQAIIAPYVLDARRCISYLTIEYRGIIPLEFRKAIGNRIYGCDDCQIICPWNKFAKTTAELDFENRRGFLKPRLLDLFAWSETEFLKRTEGSPIRRIGYECWLRNIAIALGNAPPSDVIIQALQAKLEGASDMVKEHIIWALNEQKKLILANPFD